MELPGQREGHIDATRLVETVEYDSEARHWLFPDLNVGVQFDCATCTKCVMIVWRACH